MNITVASDKDQLYARHSVQNTHLNVIVATDVRRLFVKIVYGASPMRASVSSVHAPPLPPLRCAPSWNAFATERKTNSRFVSRGFGSGEKRGRADAPVGGTAAERNGRLVQERGSRHGTQVAVDVRGQRRGKRVQVAR